VLEQGHLVGDDHQYGVFAKITHEAAHHEALKVTIHRGGWLIKQDD
jgi:hypothetical protein